MSVLTRRSKFKPVSLWSDRNQRFYQSKEWIALRDRKMQDNPVCEQCKKEGRLYTPSECVDHVIGLNDDFSLASVYGNLRALCLRCHIIKENAERKRRKDEVKQKKIRIVMDDLNDFN